MFKKAIKRMVHEADPKGSLIPVSGLNDSEKLKPLCVVLKYPPSWPWQSAKYKPTDFTLNDVLNGKSKPIKPDVAKTKFVKYEEKNLISFDGNGEVDMGLVSIEAQGSKSTWLESSLGTLQKESLNMSHFLKNSKHRKVDLQHSLIQQIRGPFNRVFTVVKERIITTDVCTIKYCGLGKGKGMTIMKTLQLIPYMKCLKGSSNAKSNTKVDMEIPPHTVVAYSVSELAINNDGSFDHVSEVDGLQEISPIKEGSSLFALKEVLADVKNNLGILAHLPTQQRVSLVDHLQDILSDRRSLSDLEDRLETLRRKESLDDLPEAANNMLQSATACADEFITPLDANGYYSKMPSMNGAYTGPTCQETDKAEGANGVHECVLTAMHMLISAVNALTDYGVITLKDLWSRNLIPCLEYLVTRLTNDSQRIPLSEIPFSLKEDEFNQMILLFNTSNITMNKDITELWAETGQDNNLLPLVLCIAICGLAYLSDTCEPDVEI